MNNFFNPLHALSNLWAGAMLRACWQGALAVLLAWALSRIFSNAPAALKAWLWRLAYLKLLLALVWSTPIQLALLPPPAHAESITALPDQSILQFADADYSLTSALSHAAPSPNAAT